MDKLNIAILFGGRSAEYGVSLESATAVIQNLSNERYNPVLIGITKDGQWRHFHGDTSLIASDSWYRPETSTPAHISPCRSHSGLIVQKTNGQTEYIPLDAAFPILHGTYGEDGTVQGLLELAGIPIVGCGTLASALCMDKHMAHIVASTAGVLSPKAHVFSKGIDMQKIRQAANELGYPLFVKPVCAGSSYGISKVLCVEDLPGAIELAFQYDSRVIIEENIPGFEVGCAILGGDSLFTGEVDEVELADGFFDFTEKYSLVTSKIHVPARISAAKAEEIKKTATAIYRVLGCKGFARVDMFIRPDGVVVFNEVNTIPGFTAHSRYPSMMQCAGLEFPELIDALIETAVRA